MIYPNRILSLDVETSGLSSQYDFITQIGAVIMEDDKIIGDPFQMRIRPTSLSKVKISAEALEAQIGGLDDDGAARKVAAWFDDLRKSTPAGDAIAAFGGWIKANVASYAPVVAFNASFDHGFVSQWAFQQKSRIDPTNWLSPMWVCPMEMAKRAYPGGKSYGLDVVLQLCGLPTRPPAHDALQDAVLAGRAYFHLKGKLDA